MKKVLALMAAAMMLVFTAGAAQAAAPPVEFNGQGLTAGQLSSVECDSEETPYLLWVLTVNGAGRTASITGPWGTEDMTQSGKGSFKFVSPYYEDLSDLNVSASYSGDAARGNPQLVISHGCPGEPPCDPYDPYGECYVCDPYDVNAPCYEGS